MLTMEQIYRIRYMKKFEGKSLRKISEITGHNIQTVKSMWRKTTLTREYVPDRKGKVNYLHIEALLPRGLSKISKHLINSSILQKSL